jgi:DNA polymerase
MNVNGEVHHSLNQKHEQFSALAAEAAECRRCPSMCGRSAVLSEKNGYLGARILFVAEAPGRQGADRTRVPFYGDQSGVNFDRYLASAGLSRDQIFITNAALCNPRTESGANRKPTRAEVENCSEYLRRTIELVGPRVVVTLGRVALEAVRAVGYHRLTLSEAAGKIFEWDGRLLVPLYHPSPQVLASHRREAAQIKDYRAIPRALRRADGETISPVTPMSSVEGS